MNDNERLQLKRLVDGREYLNSAVRMRNKRIIKWLRYYGAKMSVNIDLSLNKRPITDRQNSFMMHAIGLTLYEMRWHSAFIDGNNYSINEFLCKNAYYQLFNTILALSSLQLPPYVLLWITNHNEDKQYLKESTKIHMIQRVYDLYHIFKKTPL